ncbi:MAG TPA: hypothetical protein VIH61_03385 [Waddliaceae bacterium]
MNQISVNITRFFETYIFEPGEAGDYSKIALITTIALGILTMGVLHLAVFGINYARFGHYVKYKIVNPEDEEIGDGVVEKTGAIARDIKSVRPISWEDIVFAPPQTSVYKTEIVELLKQSGIISCPYEKIYLHPLLETGPCPAFAPEGSLYRQRDEVNSLAPHQRRLVLFLPQNEETNKKYLPYLFIHYNLEDELKLLDCNFLPYGRTKTFTGGIHSDLINIIQKTGSLPYLVERRQY